MSFTKILEEHLQEGQLQHNLCEHKQLENNAKINESFKKQSIFKMISLEVWIRSTRQTAFTQELSAAHLVAQLHELQLLKPLEEQQQKKELEKKEQLVELKNQLENGRFEHLPTWTSR